MTIPLLLRVVKTQVLANTYKENVHVPEVLKLDPF